jgi:hypothetical protein
MKHTGFLDVGLLLIAVVLSFVGMAAVVGAFAGLAWRVAQWII